MVDYSQNQPNVWGAFSGGMRIGGALRQQRQQAEYGQAYQQGGFEAVRDAAGGYGDLNTAQSAQDTMDEQEETALARATRSATVMANAASSLQGVPYEQRWQMIDRMGPLLEPLGISADQIRQFDPTDENLAMVMNIPSEFEQYSEIRSADDGAIVGIRRNGSSVVIREAPPPAWQQIPQDQLPAGARYGERNSRTGQSDIDWATGGAGQAPQRPPTPEEAEMWGIGDPAGWSIREGEAPTPIGGATGLRQRFQMSNRQRTRLQALYQQTTSNEVVLRDIERARQLAPRGAGLSSLAAGIPGTDAANLAALVDTIGANIGFDRLQQMRDASPNGSALGAVTENELRLLQSVLGSLLTSQSDEQFIENLNYLEQTYIASMERIRQAYEQDFGEEAPMINTGATGGGDGSVIGAMVGATGAGASPSGTGEMGPGGIPMDEWNRMSPQGQREIMNILSPP